MNVQSMRTSLATAVTTAWSKELDLTVVTPDMLLAYTGMKIRQLDDQVRIAFENQETRNTQTSALNKLANVLGASQKKVTDADVEEKVAIDGAYDTAIKSVGADTPLGKQLQVEWAKFRTTSRMDPNSNDDNGSVDESEMKGLLDAVGRMQSDLNQAGELEMIKLQSLMSQRAQALQLCSNLVASLSEASKSIVSKVGS